MFWNLCLLCSCFTLFVLKNKFFILCVLNSPWIESYCMWVWVTYFYLLVSINLSASIILKLRFSLCLIFSLYYFFFITRKFLFLILGSLWFMLVVICFLMTWDHNILLFPSDIFGRGGFGPHAEVFRDYLAWLFRITQEWPWEVWFLGFEPRPWLLQLHASQGLNFYTISLATDVLKTCFCPLSL